MSQEKPVMYRHVRTGELARHKKSEIVGGKNIVHTLLYRDNLEQRWHDELLRMHWGKVD